MASNAVGDDDGRVGGSGGGSWLVGWLKNCDIL